MEIPSQFHMKTIQTPFQDMFDCDVRNSKAGSAYGEVFNYYSGKNAFTVVVCAEWMFVILKKCQFHFESSANLLRFFIVFLCERILP